MKRWALWALPLIVLLSSCTVGPGNTAMSESASLSVLPPDVVRDVARTAGFQFETLLPLELKLDVNLYDTTELQRAAATVAEDVPVYVTVTDQDGSVVFTGMLHSESTLLAQLIIASSTRNLTVTLSSPGYETRTVLVDDPVSLAAVDRVVGMASTGEPADPLIDTDKDWVPDIYDAMPLDPTYCFQTTYPDRNSYLTVAYEDNYPSLGDGDYNDFVAQYRIRETYSGVLDANNNRVRVLTAVDIDAWSVARLAGYDHRFGMVVNFPGRTATVTIITYDNSNPRSYLNKTSFVATDRADFTLFEHTRDTMGYFTTVNILFPPLTIPGGEPGAGDRYGLELPPFDPYLYVYDTHQDVHLIGKPALPETQNEVVYDDFRDPQGFPRALLVPHTWAPPAESISILDAYPWFQAWMDSDGTEQQSWYLDPADPDLLYVPVYPK